MSNRRLVLPLLLGSAFTGGCGLVLGLSEFSDATTTTSSSSSSSSTSSTSSSSSSSSSGTGGSSSSSSSSGSGGAGGGAPLVCTPLKPFDVLSAADLGGESLDQTVLFTLGDATQSLAYVSVLGRTTGTLFVRSVTDKVQSPLGQLNTFVPANGDQSLEVVGGIVKNNTLALYGKAGGKTIARVDFPAKGAGASTFSSLAALDCDPTKYVRSMAVAFDPQGNMSYAATTTDNMDPGTATLCIGTEAGGAPTLVSSGPFGSNPPVGVDLLAEKLTIVGGVQLLRTGGDGPGTVAFAWGNTPAALGMRHPFSLTSDPNQLTGVLGQVPLTTGDGVLFIAATLTSGPIIPAHYWTGGVKAAQYADLESVPPVEFKNLAKVTLQEDLGQLSEPAFDQTRIISAGAGFLGDRVIFFQADRQGGLQVPHLNAYSPANGSVLAGSAVFAGFQTLVVWVEKSADSPPKYSVRGEYLSCD